VGVPKTVLQRRLLGFQRRIFHDHYSSAHALYASRPVRITKGKVPSQYSSNQCLTSIQLTEGKEPTMSTAEFSKKAVLYLKLEISAMCFFWGALWSVKFSFMALIRRLLLGRQEYENWWRIILAYRKTIRLI
jgi:hypothetical protein